MIVVSHSVVAPVDGRWLMKNRIAEIVGALPQRGWDVTLIARLSAPEPYLTAEVPHGIRLKLVRRSGRPRARDLLGAAGAVRGADRVLVFMPSLMCAPFGLLAGPKAVMYTGDAWSLQPQPVRWRGLLEAAVARRVHRVIVAGDALAERFEPVARRVDLTVPLVAPEVSGRLLAEEPPPAREPEGPLRALFVGSINPLKGVDVLVEALRDLDGVECRICGPLNPGEYGERIRAEVERMPHVTLTGYLDWDALRSQYEWADVLVLPSQIEGFPRVAYEAAAFGAALVLTPVGGVPHRLTHGEDALLPGVGDAAALRAALDRLVHDPSERRRLAARAHATLREVFREPDPIAQFDRALRAAG